MTDTASWRRSGRAWRAAALTAVLVLLTSLAALGPATTAQAGYAGPRVSLTLDQAGFLASHAIVSTETFDEVTAPKEFPLTQRTVWFSRVSYHSVAKEPTGWIVRNGSIFVGDSTNVLMRNQTLSDVRITFGGDGSVRALGLRLLPMSDGTVFRLRVTLVDGTVRYLPVTTIDYPAGQFLGVSASIGIKRLVIQQSVAADGSLTNFVLDDVSRTRITAP